MFIYMYIYTYVYRYRLAHLLWREEVERALEAAAYARVHDAHVASEALGAAVDLRQGRTGCHKDI